jgi:hypothetical protein
MAIGGVASLNGEGPNSSSSGESRGRSPSDFLVVSEELCRQAIRALTDVACAPRRCAPAPRSKGAAARANAPRSGGVQGESCFGSASARATAFYPEQLMIESGRVVLRFPLRRRGQ